MQNCHFINFDITIRGNEAPYTVMAHFTGSVAEGSFDLESSQPFWIDIENQLGNMSQPPGSALIMDAGARLYNALMQDDVQTLWTRARATLSGPETVGLRIRLALQPPTVAALPWECLTDSHRGELFAANGRTPLVRVENQERYLSTPRPLGAKLPIKILIAVPEDPMGAIDPAEAIRTKQLLQQLGENVATTEILTGRFSLIDLSRRLVDMQADVLHLITHGEPDGLLLWQGDEPAFMPAHTLRIALERAQSVKLVLLNACLAGQSSDRTPFTTVGPQLLQTGIPAVIAMQHEIDDEDAAEFSRFLYEDLLFGPCPGAIDVAVSHARSNLYVSYPDRFAFGTPVLWLNARDGQIFHLEDDGRVAPVENDQSIAPLPSVIAPLSSERPLQDPQPTSLSSSQKPTLDPALIASWLSERCAEVEQSDQTEAWEILRFDWEKSIGELEHLIRQIEREQADGTTTGEQFQITAAQVEKLMKKIGKLAEAICQADQSEEPTNGTTRDRV